MDSTYIHYWINEDLRLSFGSASHLPESSGWKTTPPKKNHPLQRSPPSRSFRAKNNSCSGTWPFLVKIDVGNEGDDFGVVTHVFFGKKKQQPNEISGSLKKNTRILLAFFSGPFSSIVMKSWERLFKPLTGGLRENPLHVTPLIVGWKCTPGKPSYFRPFIGVITLLITSRGPPCVCLRFALLNTSILDNLFISFHLEATLAVTSTFALRMGDIWVPILQ